MQDISPQDGERPSFSLSRGQAVPPIQRCAAGGEKRPVLGCAEWPPSAAGSAGVHRRECRRLAAETKGGKGTIWVPCPLLTPPNPPLRRDSLRSRGETGETGLGSVRRTDFEMLLCPEFTLRDLPRITVRGQTVQGGGTPHAMSWRITPCPGGPLSPSAASRRNGGTAPPLPRGKSFLFSLLTGLCYCIIIIVQHNKKGLRLCSGSFVGIARSTSRSWKS